MTNSFPMMVRCALGISPDIDTARRKILQKIQDYHSEVDIQKALHTDLMQALENDFQVCQDKNTKIDILNLKRNVFNNRYFQAKKSYAVLSKNTRPLFDKWISKSDEVTSRLSHLEEDAFQSYPELLLKNKVYLNSLIDYTAKDYLFFLRNLKYMNNVRVATKSRNKFFKKMFSNYYRKCLNTTPFGYDNWVEIESPQDYNKNINNNKLAPVSILSLMPILYSSCEYQDKIVVFSPDTVFINGNYIYFTKLNWGNEKYEISKFNTKDISTEALSFIKEKKRGTQKEVSKLLGKETTEKLINMGLLRYSIFTSPRLNLELALHSSVSNNNKEKLESTLSFNTGDLLGQVATKIKDAKISYKNISIKSIEDFSYKNKQLHESYRVLKNIPELNRVDGPTSPKHFFYYDNIKIVRRVKDGSSIASSDAIVNWYRKTYKFSKNFIERELVRNVLGIKKRTLVEAAYNYLHDFNEQKRMRILNNMPLYIERAGFMDSLIENVYKGKNDITDMVNNFPDYSSNSLESISFLSSKVGNSIFASGFQTLTGYGKFLSRFTKDDTTLLSQIKKQNDELGIIQVLGEEVFPGNFNPILSSKHAYLSDYFFHNGHLGISSFHYSSEEARLSVDSKFKKQHLVELGFLDARSLSPILKFINVLGSTTGFSLRIPWRDTAPKMDKDILFLPSVIYQKVVGTRKKILLSPKVFQRRNGFYDFFQTISSIIKPYFKGNILFYKIFVRKDQKGNYLPRGFKSQLLDLLNPFSIMNFKSEVSRNCLMVELEEYFPCHSNKVKMQTLTHLVV